ncbi:MAG: DUF1036 domain-containing protein [Phormidium sp.]|nr:MAG: putative integral membrane protein [Phormidium sp. OSCR]
MLNKDFLIKTLGSVSVFCAGLVALPEASEAQLRICNETLAPVEVVVGYPTYIDVSSLDRVRRNRPRQTLTRWDSRGWYTLRPRQCQTVVPGPLRNRYYYFYGQTQRGGRTRYWRGDSAFCIRSEAFTAQGTNCSSGYRRQGFQRIDIGPRATRFTLNLTQSSYDN